MTGDDQKSIVVDIQMRQGEKWFMLEFDKKLRRCTGVCLSQALKQGIGKGDEVLYTINHQDLFSYLKKTGQHFDLKEQPQPATSAPVIDAEKEQAQITKDGFLDVAGAFLPPTKESTRINHEVHRSEIIMWEALLNTATEIVLFGGDEKEELIVDGIVMEVTTEQAVKRVAENLHAFIMDKVGGEK
jgi:hypothetical protein